MTTTTKNTERDEALARLREIFPPGSTAKTILRHVTRSGMSRSISVVTPDCEDVTYLLVRADLGNFDQRNGGVKVGGCGMDMGFSLVYNMSRAMYPDGFECIAQEGDRWPGDRCPSNDHSNREHNAWHKDGGYAVSQRWL